MVRYRARQISDKAIEQYDMAMRASDWKVSEDETVEEAVARLHRTIQMNTDRYFPWKNYKVRSTDDPWVEEATRKKIRQRKTVFERDQRRTKEWREIKAVTNTMLKNRKRAYYEKECEKLKAEGSHAVPYKALKALSLAERPPQFDPRQLRPGMTDQELVEDMALFFATISKEFKPLEEASLPVTYHREPLQVNQQAVHDRLIEMNKPKSAVLIDPLSRFVNMHADLYSPTLTKIVNEILRGHKWPSLWSEEEVSIIPKTNHVTDYDGCRNISCTSIFSKLAETFMMDLLLEEVTLHGPQYGGLKGSGPPHLLAELVTVK